MNIQKVTIELDDGNSRSVDGKILDNIILEFKDGTMESNGEVFSRSISQIMSQFKKPRNMIWLINHLLKEIEKAGSAVKRYKVYYQNNRKKLDEYHKQYRTNEVSYAEKRRKRARLYKQKVKNG